MNTPATRVLIIEDNEDDYIIVRDLLDDIISQTFNVEWVETIEDARKALDAGKYDVCLVDHRLAGRSGLALIEEQILGDPPFILLTGNEDHEVDIAATKAGAMDFLVKGHITAPSLERSMRYAIERARHAAMLEEALKQSHLLATAVRSFTDGMIVTDPRQADNPIIFSNPAFSAITGYFRDEIVGRNCRFLQGPDTDRSTVEQMRIAIEEKRPFSGVILNYRKDGTPFWNGIKITPVFDSEGELINFVGLQADVTARRQVEMALQESQARNSAILEAALDGIITIDHQNDIVGLNPAAEQMFGYPRDEAMGRSVKELLLVPELRVGQQIQILGQRSDGGQFPIELAVTRIKVEGKPLFTAYLRDITARKQAEDSLRRSEANLRAAQRIARLGSWELDLTETLDPAINSLHWSDEVFRIFGCEPEQTEVSYENFFLAVHPDDRPRVNAAQIQALRNNQPLNLDHRIILPDGTERVVHEQADVFRDENSGTAFKMVGTVQDITERKRADAQLEFQKALLEAQTETSLDGILAVSDEGKILSCNRRFGQLWDIPQAIISQGEDAKLLEAVLEKVADSERFLQRVTHLYQNRQEESHEEIALRDGRVFDRYSAPITNADGFYYGRVWYFRDITERKAAAQAAAHLAAIVEYSNDAIVGKSLDDTIVSWNAGAEALYGYTAQEAIGRRVTDLIAPTGSANPAFLAEQISGGEFLSNYETVRAHKDGHTVDVSMTVSPIKDESGKIIGLAANARDISDRKRAENALRESEARSRAVIENALDCIITIDHERRVTEFNPAAEATFGYTRAEALGKDIADLIVPFQMHEAHRTGFAQYPETGESTMLNRRMEMPARCKDGREITVELAATAIAHSSPPQFIAYLRDITERRQAETALKESEDRFASIVANVPGMVYQLVVRPDGPTELPFVSQGCREIYETEPEILQNDPALLANMVHPEDRLDYDRSWAAAAEAMSPWSWEGRVCMNSGRTKWIQVAARPWGLSNVSVAWNGVVIDITEHKQVEAERDRFFTTTIDMLGIAGFDGYFKRLNPAFTEVLGFSEAELMERPSLDFVHPEDRAATLAARDRLLDGKATVGLQNRYRTKDGSWRWLEWKSVAVPEEKLVYAAARDITGSKEAEVALLRANDDLEERVHRRTEELEQTNLALQFQIAEREGAEAKTRARARQQEAVAELGRRALANVDLNTLLQGALSLSAAVLDVNYGVLVEWLPDNSKVRIQAAVGQPNYPVLAEVPALPGSLTDYVLNSKAPVVVENMASETRFLISPLMHEQGLKSMVALTIQTGDQLSSTSYYGAIAVGSPQERAFSQDDVNFLQSISNILATAINRHQVESEIRALNSQLNQSNEQLRVENIEHQVTMSTLHMAVQAHQEAKEEAELAYKEAERANRAKSEFLSRMSHELRTPLNAILGFGQILDRQQLTALQRESIGYILKGGRHLLALINEVLDIARVETGHVELSLESIDLSDIVAECCDLVRPLIDERGINLVNDLQTDNLVNTVVAAHGSGTNHVLGDRQRLKQVLINLLSNAIKYNRTGGNVEISVRQTSEERLQLRVSDSGVGLSSQDLKKLFTPFERLGAADSTIEGTGLGLVLSQRLMTAMGGILDVESHLGQGSTFWIELPKAQSPLQNLSPATGVAPVETAGEAVVIGPTVEGAVSTPAKYTVLSIEDNLSNIRLLEAILSSRSDIALLTATQGRIGLEMAYQHHPDLILLDLHLPGLSGSDVLAKLQQSNDTKQIPVIVISADATPSNIERLLEAGATAYLTKPLDIRAFLSTLDETLQANQADTKPSITDEVAQ